MIKIKDLYDLSQTLAYEHLENFTYPWEALSGISAFIKTLGDSLPTNLYTQVTPEVWMHKTATVSPTASISPPCIIGANTEIRHCAFIRGSVLVGENCVVGNSTELKNVILFNNVQVPHYNYVGDSILGHFAHMGAGSITSNVKGDKSLVEIKSPDEIIATNLKKVGAFLGDHTEIGCNSVLNPGTVIGKNTSVYPLTSVRGAIPENSILKSNNTISKKI